MNGNPNGRARRSPALSYLPLAVAVLLALAVFLTLQGLDAADKWASVIALFVAAVGALWSGLQAIRRRADDEDELLCRTLDATPRYHGDPRKIGPFTVLGRVGAGSMGQVYLGRDGRGGLAAVKVMNTNLVAVPEFRERFRRELRDLGRVTGAHFVPVLASDAEAATPWVAFEYFPGLRLDEVIGSAGPWSLAATAWLGFHVASALEVIHAAGIVHRDLKPANVLVGRDEIRVIDFGIARSALDTHVTRTGSILGTVAFMSPEQATGDTEPGGASDVFTLGSLLAYTATKRPPFGSEPWHVVMQRILQSEPELGGLATQQDASFDAFAASVRACLAKSPQDRPALAEIIAVTREHAALPMHRWLPAELQDRLTRRYGALPAATEGQPAAEARRRGVRRRLVGVAAALLLFAVFVPVSRSWSTGSPAIRWSGAPVQTTTPVPEPQASDGDRAALDAYLTGTVEVGIADNLPGWGVKTGESATGFDPALITFLAGRHHFTPHWVTLTPAQRSPKLIDGSVKLVAAAFSYDVNRAKTVTFAGPYFHDRSGILCSPWKTAACAAGIRPEQICVYPGTEASHNIQGATRDESIHECVQDLKQGAKDLVAVSTDETILSAYSADFGTVGTAQWVDSPGHPISEEFYGIAVPHGRADLCRALNADIDDFLSQPSGWQDAFARNLGGVQHVENRKPERTDPSWCTAG